MRTFTKRLIYVGLGFGVLACGQDKQDQGEILSIDHETMEALESGGIELNRQEAISDGEYKVEVAPDELGRISTLMHTTMNKCGGYFHYDSEDELAQEALELKMLSPIALVNGYSISESIRVESAIQEVSNKTIVSTIESLSAFHNRYYKSETGVDSQKWLHDYWTQISQGRADIQVDYWQHSKWDQPSVVATIHGESNPDEIIVLGGHGDSIVQSLFFTSKKRAPGADDNASGIAVITEALRVIVESGYRPSRTIKFMSYAAEEVGLRGSKEIAGKMRDQSANVIAAVQFDMTNFKNGDTISLIEDHTDPNLTRFLGDLLDEYVKVPWKLDRCGYACSDHASWNRNGFPVATAFETAVKKMNRKIHTQNDTLDNSDKSGIHATHFAKLAVAFAIEIAK